MWKGFIWKTTHNTPDRRQHTTHNRPEKLTPKQSQWTLHSTRMLQWDSPRTDTLDCKWMAVPWLDEGVQPSCFPPVERGKEREKQRAREKRRRREDKWADNVGTETQQQLTWGHEVDKRQRRQLPCLQCIALLTAIPIFLHSARNLLRCCDALLRYSERLRSQSWAQQQEEEKEEDDSETEAELLPTCSASSPDQQTPTLWVCWALPICRFRPGISKLTLWITACAYSAEERTEQPPKQAINNEKKYTYSRQRTSRRAYIKTLMIYTVFAKPTLLYNTNSVA